MIRAVALALGGLLLAASGTMQLRSDDFPAGGRIGRAFMATDCGGENRSPQLSWSEAPRGVKSFALIVHDPDAPISGGFYHWVVYDLPPTVHAVARNAGLRKEQLGMTSAGTQGYYGPCPPPGPIHHYHFTVYALDVASLAHAAPLTGPQVEHQVAGHTLGRAMLQGVAAR